MPWPGWWLLGSGLLPAKDAVMTCATCGKTISAKDAPICDSCIDAGWFKSSYSGNGDCIEIIFQLGGGVLIRDTKDRTGPVLAFTEEEWRAFIAGVRNHEFDGPDDRDCGCRGLTTCMECTSPDDYEPAA